MYIVRYRTHGPWQQDTFEDVAYVEAYKLAHELKTSYREVRVETFNLVVSFKEGVDEDGEEVKGG